MTDALLQITKNGSAVPHTGRSILRYFMLLLPPPAQTNLGILSFSLVPLMPVGNIMLVVELCLLSVCLLQGDWKDECVTLCFLGRKMGSAFADYI